MTGIPPKHSKYSELDEILKNFFDKLDQLNERSDYTWDDCFDEAKTALQTYINKEKAKAELAARFKYEPAIAHAIGYCRGLGHPESYLEKQFPELAQLASEDKGE